MLPENPLLNALERIGCAGVLLDEAGGILATNAIASQILNGHDASESSARDQLKTMLRSAGQRFRLDAEAWVMIPQECKRPLAMHAIPVGDSEDPYSRTVLIIVDLENHPQPSPLALRRMFGLTAAEAALAILLAKGESPTDIARQKAVSLATVRTQLAAIYAKTQTRRLADLVALLSRVAILP